MKRETSLNLLYPPFLYRLLKGVKAARAAGIPLHVFESYRSPARQQWLYEQGRSREGRIVTRARAGRSWHNYGIATDLVLVIDGKWTWEHEDLYVRAAPYLEACGLQWQGRSKKFVELVHYQLPVEISIYEVEAIYKTDGLLGVWQKFNDRYGDGELWKS
jgi:peptidoglycan L-alanyl-D-glutamate endopeptidase CwlK